MKACSGTGRYTHTAVKKTTMLMALLAAVFLVAVLSIGIQDVYAEDGTALTVRMDGEVKCELTYADLDSIATEEGNKTYTYSAWNTYPTFDSTSYVNKTGATVRGILEFAGVYDEISDDSTILFTDGAYKSMLTGYQLIKETRYYYPDGKLADPVNGPAPEASYKGAVPVDAIVHNAGGNDKLVLLVGQAAPNDENKPAFCKHLKTIDITTSGAKKCDLPEAVPASGSVCSKGQEIVLNMSGGSMQYVYYTMDGSEPDYGSQIYNSGDYQDVETRPVLPDDYGDYTVTVKVKGYGKADSDVGTYTYPVRPEAPSGITAAAGYNRVSLSWGAAPDAKGYNIYRSVAGGEYALYASVGAGTLATTDTAVTAGTLYYYQVAAIDYSQNGTAFESNRTQAAGPVSPAQAAVTPEAIRDLKAVKIAKPKAAKKKVTVKWKKISKKDQKKIGGIEIQIAANKAFTQIVKTTTARKSKTAKTIKGLKSGKTYWVRIRAYRSAADGKHVSAWKTKKFKVK